MEKTFLVLKDADGELFPMAFIARNNESGRVSAELYEKKMNEGDTIVAVKLVEVTQN